MGEDVGPIERDPSWTMWKIIPMRDMGEDVGPIGGDASWMMATIAPMRAMEKSALNRRAKPPSHIVSEADLRALSRVILDNVAHDRKKSSPTIPTAQQYQEKWWNWARSSSRVRSTRQP